MCRFVWVVTFYSCSGERDVFGVFVSREKAVEAVEQAAKDWNEYLPKDWSTNFFTDVYSDEQLTKPTGRYAIRRYKLQ